MNKAALGLLSVSLGLLLIMALVIGLNQVGAEATEPLPEQFAIVVDLGTLGGEESAAYGINNNMRVVGAATDSDGVWHAFLWFEDEMTGLGLTGEMASYAYGINEPKRSVGVVYSNTLLVNGEPRQIPYLWDREMATPLEAEDGIAQDINNSGHVVGMVTSADPAPLPIAAIWDDGSPPQILGTLEGGDSSWAWRINEPGQIVGKSTNSDGLWRAFYWDDDTMIDIGTLGGSESGAYGINNRRQVVGAADLDGDTVSHAFLWDGQIMTDLGAVGEPADVAILNSAGFSINTPGTIVGYSEVFVDGGNVENHAVVWQNGALIDLNELLGPNSGWQLLTHAYSINNGGWIVGEGYNDDGERHGFLMNLPTEAFFPISFAPISR